MNFQPMITTYWIVYLPNWLCSFVCYLVDDLLWKDVWLVHQWCI